MERKEKNEERKQERKARGKEIIKNQTTDC
jgi:hypothetical protein